ncbi:hypothetical protein C1I98_10535 [Spongiactinospora gelatinilytica]|uniref:DUF4239 domain-containing protein n=1 Tax=Spongiactinospora gelatinilytica TaxID=2666298 RepID=A0A2W2GLP7_9ACTN|nr:DUF4239 domain-containing protein [Spongiactinospora gelatinilytica]PZG50466.1 hypothetical protein C1I98_10535 [Spongiactinospora gelatinilytica]
MGWVSIAASAAFVLLVLAIVVLRKKGQEHQEQRFSAVDFAANIALAVYLLVLAYAVVLCKDAITAAEADSAAESETLTELYWTLAPIPEAAPLKVQIRQYTNQSITLDWPMMSNDTLSPLPGRTLDELRAALHRLRPAEPAHENLRQEALSRAADLSHARALRADDAATRLEDIFMISMALSGALVIALPWTLGIRPTFATVVSDAIRVTVVVVGVVFVQLSSHPYSGFNAVEPTAFEVAVQQFDRIDRQLAPPQS